MFKFIFNLQRFAEGGADAGASTSADNAQVEKGGDDGHNEELFETAADNSENIENVTEPEKATFEDLITGDYKADFDNAVQNIVKKRVKGMQAQINDMQPLLETLAEKYGVKDNDPKSILESIMDDDSYYEQYALENGVDVETAKHMKKLEMENADVKRQLEDYHNEEEKIRMWSDLERQADELRNIYPGFNLEAELGNENFGNLLSAGVDLRTAFEVTHHDELVPQAMKLVADKAAQKVSNAVKANKSRPTEGTTTQPLRVRKDWKNLSPEARDRLNQRILEGEIITI